jgi:hypothetical protein
VSAEQGSVETGGAPRLVPGRACGTCMMCCKVPAIEEFAKPPGVWCRHAVSGKGCNIYADRPRSCRAFYCAWMQDESFGPDWKPEKAKFVVYLQENSANLQVAVDPSFPNAWTRPPYYARIKKWAADGAADGRFVVSRQPGPTGFVYAVEVKRGPAPPQAPSRASSA